MGLLLYTQSEFRNHEKLKYFGRHSELHSKRKKSAFNKKTVSKTTKASS